MSTRARRRTAGTAVKVVVTGPFGAGKTTLIRTISEITVLSTEKDVSDPVRAGKPETTVAMDFGRITVDRDLVLYLFGTPGQERFEFMWDILGEGMLGYVLLLDGDRGESLTEAVGILEAFRRMAPVPFVVAVNRRREVPDVDVEHIRTVLALEDGVPVLPVDATDRASVKETLLALLYVVLETVGDADAAANA